MVEKAIRARGEIGWVLFGYLLTFAGTFIGLKVLTISLGPERYGGLALGLAISGVIGTFVYGPINQWVLRFYSIHQERQRFNSFFSMIVLVYTASLLCIVGVTIIGLLVFLPLLSKQWIFLGLVATLFAVVSGFNGLFLSLQSARRNRKVVALYQSAESILKPMFAIIFLYLFGKSDYYALLGFCLASFLVMLFQGMAVSRDVVLSPIFSLQAFQGSSIKQEKKEFMNYVTPFLYFSIFGSIFLYGDRWILQFSMGDKSVGIYAALYQIANAPILVTAGIVSQLIMPVAFGKAGEMKNERQQKDSKMLIRQSVWIMLLIFIAILVIVSYFDDTLVRLLTTEEFVEQSSTLWILVAGLALFNIAQTFSIYGFSSMQTNIYILPKAIQAILFLVLCVYFVEVSGIRGVAISIILSSAVYLVSVIVANKRLRIKYTSI